VNVLGRIKPDVGSQENVLARADGLHAHVLTFEIRDATDALSGKNFEAADVLAADDRDRFASIDCNS
jgi:hypothetical protein